MHTASRRLPAASRLNPPALPRSGAMAPYAARGLLSPDGPCPTGLPALAVGAAFAPAVGWETRPAAPLIQHRTDLRRSLPTLRRGARTLRLVVDDAESVRMGTMGKRV